MVFTRPREGAYFIVFSMLYKKIFMWFPTNNAEANQPTGMSLVLLLSAPP